MTQLIYAVSALALVMLLTVGIQRAGLHAEREIYLTEARTRMLAAARETVERITRLDMPFDYATDPDRGAAGKTFPYVSSPGELTGKGGFGGCGLAQTYDLSPCLDIDDFHGVGPVADSVDGLPVQFEFSVAYVDTLTGAESMLATYAKELTVTVTSPAFRTATDTLTVQYSRVFAYPSPMDFARGVQSRL